MPFGTTAWYSLPTRMARSSISSAGVLIRVDIVAMLQIYDVHVRPLKNAECKKGLMFLNHVKILQADCSDLKMLPAAGRLDVWRRCKQVCKIKFLLQSAIKGARLCVCRTYKTCFVFFFWLLFIAPLEIAAAAKLTVCQDSEEGVADLKRGGV